MKLKLIPALLLAAALSGTGVAVSDTSTQISAPAALDAKHDPKLGAHLDAAFKDLARRNLFSGTVLIAKGNKVLFQGAYGLASKEYNIPNTLDTQFNLGSSNKMFAAISIAQLVEQGKLSFDDPIGKYLGADWVNPDVGKKVTIAHLLTHTSGLTDIFGSEEIRLGSKDRFKDIKDYAPIAAKMTLTREPGTQWSYCNTGFLLLGVIVEKVSGVPYFDYIQKNVLDRAGMSRTASLDMEKINTGFAQGYGKTPKVQTPPPMRGPAPPVFIDTIFGAADRQYKLEHDGYDWMNNAVRNFVKGTPQGGMDSTAPDLLKFANAFTSGKLVSPQMVRLMTTPKPPAASNWGYGMMMADANGFGHGGGFIGISALTIMYPGDYTFIALSNVDGGAQVALDEVYQLAGLKPARPATGT